MELFERGIIGNDMFDGVKDKIYGDPPVKLVISSNGQGYMHKWFEKLHPLTDSVGIYFVATHMRLALGPNYISRLSSALTGIDISPQDMMHTAESLVNLFKVCAVRKDMVRKDDFWPDGSREAHTYSRPNP